METFESEVELENIDDSYSAGKVKLKWQVDFDLRNWGIKDITPMVPDQKIEATVSVENEVTGDYEDKDVEIELKDAKIDIEGNLDYGSFHLWPEKIEIWRKKVTVTFSV